MPSTVARSPEIHQRARLGDRVRDRLHAAGRPLGTFSCPLPGTTPELAQAARNPRKDMYVTCTRARNPAWIEGLQHARRSWTTASRRRRRGGRARHRREVGRQDALGPLGLPAPLHGGACRHLSGGVKEEQRATSSAWRFASHVPRCGERSPRTPTVNVPRSPTPKEGNVRERLRGYTCRSERMRSPRHCVSGTAVIPNYSTPMTTPDRSSSAAL
jgi:hypothetical protein